MIMLNVEIGMKVVANYGAMFPTIEGVVEHIEYDGLGDPCLVWFRDTSEEEGTLYSTSNIREQGERSVNGSPIGVFFA
jgi:hypothetical protein